MNARSYEIHQNLIKRVTTKTEDFFDQIEEKNIVRVRFQKKKIKIQIF